jgi:hypothetical protein
VPGERSSKEANSREIVETLLFQAGKASRAFCEEIIRWLATPLESCKSPPGLPLLQWCSFHAFTCPGTLVWWLVKILQLKDAAQLALKKMPSAEQEALSQVIIYLFIIIFFYEYAGDKC